MIKKNTQIYLILLSVFTCFALSTLAQESVENGDAFYLSYKYKEAIKEYEHAIKNNRTTKNEVHILRNLAYSYLYTFQYAKAEQKFTELIRLGDKKPDPDDYLEYGNLLKINDKYDQAREQFVYYNKLLQKDSYTAFLEKSLAWAIKNKDNVRPATFVGVTTLNVSGQSLGYTFFDDGVIYSQAIDTIEDEFTQIFDLRFARKIDSTNFISTENDLVSEIKFPYNEGFPHLAPDGETLYFMATGAKIKDGEVKKSGKSEISKDGVSNLRLYSAKLINGKFEQVQELSFNNKDYNFVHPAITADGNTLYFASDMAGGYGGLDIYRTNRNQDGTWTTPINLGDKINTTEHDGFPFLKDNKLYFASKGHVGFGGYDIFECTIGNNYTYGASTNMGKPYNSSKDDIAFVMNKDGQTGYFSSNRDSYNGFDKVYYFNSNYTPIVKRTEIPKKDTVLTTIAVNETKLKTGANKITTEPEIKTKTTSKPIIAKGTIISEKAVYYDFNSSNLPNDLTLLNEAVIIWKADKSSSIQLLGYTDCRGEAGYNKGLSQKRANAVSTYLIKQGVAANKISKAGMGDVRTESCSDCTSCSEDIHNLNRKVQIIIRK